MINTILMRAGIDVLLFVMVLTTPWWLSVFMVLFCMVYFRLFIEGVLAGVVLDVLFGNGLFYTTLFALLFAVSVVLRPRIRFGTS